VALQPSSPVSELLLHWGNGDRKALEAILPLVYNELRRLARYHLRQQRPNHTLQTTRWSTRLTSGLPAKNLSGWKIARTSLALLLN
jgi:ECF sigma factor